MKKLIALFLFVCTPAWAADATSIMGVTIDTLPSFSANPMPNGDTADDFVVGYCPATSDFCVKRPQVTGGPSALTANAGLTSGSWVYMWGSINYSNHGFRDQFVAYVPKGVWNLSDGRIVIAGPTNCEYDVLVTQGMVLSTDTGRPGIISDSPIVVGGGATTWTGAANYPFTVQFSAAGIQCAALYNQACEIGVKVKAHCSSGSALGSITDVAAPFLSTFYIQRQRTL